MKASSESSRLSFCALIFLAVATVHAASERPIENVTNMGVDAEWIWSAGHQKDRVPVGDCYFRNSFELRAPIFGEVHITADNRFELSVNGVSVGKGEDWRQLEVYDISEHLKPGKNCIAVLVTNIDEGSAGLVARVLVKEKSGTLKSYSTDRSWKSSVRQYQNWTSSDFPDSEWVEAKTYGLLGETLPWGDEIVFAGEGSRFQIGAEFAIERMMRDEEVGSLIAMTFDSQGNIIASRERDTLLLLTDSNDNGTHDTVSVYCNKIRNVQGLLALGTRVFAVGDGPEGVALYRLRDADRDGIAEEITSLVPIRGSRGEHGAHAVRLGPDGLLYVIIGDHARLGPQPGPRSPYRNWYEGDLVQPKHEDPQGHAAGIPAPGGTIFRTDAKGSFLELIAGGLRNSYDFAFNPAGELFTYDADMEWDMGAPWYRPTRINHVTAGAELGWRSGWSKWPTYYLDSLPPALNIGAGSPTGVEFYNHTAFPERYRNVLFCCDWATGRIHCVRLQPHGASYRATSEVFLEGKPLNATDLAVGPDGALYFCTGGRGTDGGVYRVRWEKAPADETVDLGEGIDRALRQPQLDADWARAKVVAVQRELGNRWSSELTAVVQDKRRSLADRLRAIDLMVTFGPRPQEPLLLTLTQDDQPQVRAKATRLLYTYPTPSIRDRLTALLRDQDPSVRRIACESLGRMGGPGPAEVLVQLLADDDRFVAFAARRALEQLPTEGWADQVLRATEERIFCYGAVALLSTKTGAAHASMVLEQCQKSISAAQPLDENAGDVNPTVNLLRVTQLALRQGKLRLGAASRLGRTLLDKYPSGNPAADRELVRLLVYLQVPGAAEAFAAQLASDLPDAERLHVAAYAARLDSGWSNESKIELIKFFEQVRQDSGGYSVSAYIEEFAREFLTKFTLKERQSLLAKGESWPTSALSVLAKLPIEPGAEILSELRSLDGRIKPLLEESDDFRRLRVGILAVLGRSSDAESHAYLHTIFRDEPELRSPVAMSLSQQPGGENWQYLIDSLSGVEGNVAREVLAALASVARRPGHPEPFRQVILQGLRLGENGAQEAVSLLDHWAMQKPRGAHSDWKASLRTWQQWYAQNFPAAPPAELPVDSGSDKWTYEELLTYLSGTAARGANPSRGQRAFATAECVKCHRCGTNGETLGPDLTTVASRFQKKEILESIVYPSHNISDQYASQVIETNGRSYAGLVLPRGKTGVTVLLSDGETMELDHADVDRITPSQVSSMPAGLLNKLTLEQVADLFAYLQQGARTEIARKKTDTNR